jgi:hypothetical protein
MSLSDLTVTIDSERTAKIFQRRSVFSFSIFYRYQLFAADHLLRSVAPLPELVP